VDWEEIDHIHTEKGQYTFHNTGSTYHTVSRSRSPNRQSKLGAAQKGKSMYAVIRTGGKQYRVTAGDTLEVERLEGSVGDTITLSDILLVADGDSVTIGQPVVEGASVTAKISGQHRGTKVHVFRYRPKKRIRVRRGHRQYLTRLEIQSISL
jgi:large subunit ribosomal protein L21